MGPEAERRSRLGCGGGCGCGIVRHRRKVVTLKPLGAWFGGSGEALAVRHTRV
jgi:hypothetical protein